MRMRLEIASLVLGLTWIMELRLAWKGKLEFHGRHDVIHAEIFMNGLTMLIAKLAHGLTNGVSISLENSNIATMLEHAFHTNKTIQDLVAKTKCLSTLVKQRLGVSFMRSPDKEVNLQVPHTIVVVGPPNVRPPFALLIAHFRGSTTLSN